MKSLRSLQHKFVTKFGARRVRTSSDIVTLKTMAWQKKSAGKHYAEVVDKHIFKELMLPTFIKNLENSVSILEVGSGTGRLTCELLEAGHIVTATDVSESMLAQLKPQKNLTKQVVDAHNLPYPDESFDGVASLDFMSHFPTWKTLLGEQLRVLQPGGTLLFSYLTEENFLAQEKKVETTSKVPVAVAEIGAIMSVEDMRDVCSQNSACLKHVVPYGVFWGNDIYSGFLTRKEARDVSLQFYKRFNSSHLFREHYINFEKKLMTSNDPSISSRAIAVIRKNI